MKQMLTLGLLLLVSFGAQGESRLLWGDTHLHTSNSFDAFIIGNINGDPDMAYRYAKGLPVEHPYHGGSVRIQTPLDFLVVSDHAEMMGVIKYVYHNGVPGEGLSLWQKIVGFGSTLAIRGALKVKKGPALFGSRLPEPEDAASAAQTMSQLALDATGIPPLPEVEAAVWAATTEAADNHNEPGQFTALIGWEWSANPGGSNLHRIVITDSGAEVAKLYQPFSLINSPFPEDLWAWLDKVSANTGAGFISIPHNSNISKGAMFDTRTLHNQPLTVDYVQRRMKWEKLVEITQIKGDSEAHPDLSPDDEFADFETFGHYIQRYPQPYVAKPGDYVRSGLMRGLELEKELGSNPYQFGVIGSTDAHTAMATAEEDNFQGKFVPHGVLEKKGSRFARSEGAPDGWDMSASGLAAVWARDNTRKEILAAMKRREVYATTGPRIAVQFFAGDGYAEDVLESPDIYGMATERGVPMGSEIDFPLSASPQFLVVAEKDALGANLDRIQIVKGWTGEDGKAREKVFNVAWSEGRSLDFQGQLNAVGNTVDKETANYGNTIGAPRLAVSWQDPEFNPQAPAFYYVRVLQIPTPRHSLYDSVAMRKAVAEGRPQTIQERAYTSPIWYRPE